MPTRVCQVMQVVTILDLGATVGGAYLPAPYQLLISSAEASAFSLAVETQKVPIDCYANTT